MNRRALLKGAAAAIALAPLAPLVPRAAPTAAATGADWAWIHALHRQASVVKLAAVIPVTDELIADYGAFCRAWDAQWTGLDG
jgi:hypothetical protein